MLLALLIVLGIMVLVACSIQIAIWSIKSFYKAAPTILILSVVFILMFIMETHG